RPPPGCSAATLRGHGPTASSGSRPHPRPRPAGPPHRTAPRRAAPNVTPSAPQRLVTRSHLNARLLQGSPNATGKGHRARTVTVDEYCIDLDRQFRAMTAHQHTVTDQTHRPVENFIRILQYGTGH